MHLRKRESCGTRALCMLIVLLAGASPVMGSGPDGPDEKTGKSRNSDGKAGKAIDRVRLGFFLFKSTLLSKTGQVSCATCHDPDKFFTDGLSEASGALQMGVGRNSPTLIALSQVKTYPDPRPPVPIFDMPVSHGRPAVAKLRALTLEERCLVPIENPLEMGNSVKAVVAVLRSKPGMSRRFDHAFGKSPVGVTVERVGKALSAYVKSLRPPMSPYREFLGGDARALNGGQKLGMSIFNGRGKCNACHSGVALTDGLMHVVAPRTGMRAQIQRRRGRELAFQASQSLLRLGRQGGRRGILGNGLAEALVSTGGYGTPQAEVQTTTLWDVARTGPYFRDGSIQSLRQAVRQHVRELRQVSMEIGPRSGRAFLPTRHLPKILRPSFAPGAQRATPEDLSQPDMDRVVTFMRTFSPRLGLR